MAFKLGKNNEITNIETFWEKYQLFLWASGYWNHSWSHYDCHKLNETIIQ